MARAQVPLLRHSEPNGVGSQLDANQHLPDRPASPINLQPINKTSPINLQCRSTGPHRSPGKDIVMTEQIAALWAYVRARAGVSGGWDEAGTVVEKVILTAVFAALAIAVGAIIVAKVTAKANSINLN